MSTEQQAEVAVDPGRVEQLEAPFRDFRERWLHPPSLPRRVWLTLRHQFKDYYFVGPPRWRRARRARQWQQRPAPEFVSTGAVRSGTSALANYLFQHPCVALPLAKEPPLDFSLKMVRANYPTETERAAVRDRFGQAITGYCAPVAASINFAYGARWLNPDMKIVLILRDPVARAFSHFRWDGQLMARAGGEHSIAAATPSFDEMVEIEIANADRGGIGWTTMAGVSGYLRQSLYLPFVASLYDVFPPERIRVVNASDFFADPTSVVEDLYAFLDLPRCKPIVSAEKNAGPVGELSESTATRLREFFAPHNRRLYEFLDRDFGW